MHIEKFQVDKIQNGRLSAIIKFILQACGDLIDMNEWRQGWPYVN